MAHPGGMPDMERSPNGCCRPPRDAAETGAAVRNLDLELGVAQCCGSSGDAANGVEHHFCHETSNGINSTNCSNSGSPSSRSSGIDGDAANGVEHEGLAESLPNGSISSGDLISGSQRPRPAGDSASLIAPVCDQLANLTTLSQVGGCVGRAVYGPLG